MTTLFYFYPNLKFTCHQIRWVWFFPIPCSSAQEQAWDSWRGELAWLRLHPRMMKGEEFSRVDGIFKGAIKIMVHGIQAG